MNDQALPENIGNTVLTPDEQGIDLDKFQLSELVDTAELNVLLDNFCNAVGIASAIIDLQGKVLISSRWQRICTDFHRINESTCARCIESDTDLALRLKVGESFSVYNCKNGMTDAASPIIIEGKHMANVFVGQFLLAPPDRDFFARQAEQFGFDRQAYFKALDIVPIVPESKLPSILGFLSGFAKLVASMGLQRLRAERASAELSVHKIKLEQLVAERTEALKESEARYRTLVEWSPEPLAVHRAGKIVYVNPAAVKMIGASSANDLVGEPILNWIHPDYHQIVLERAKKAATLKTSLPMIEEKFIKLDGSTIDVEVQSTAIIFDGVPAVQAIMRDITERKANADAINNLAFFDTLTGLPNRRLLLDRLKQALASSSRSGRKGALLFIDLDNFKTLNDSLGHDIGDLLLQQVAHRLEHSIREGDSVARLGGDEFVVMLEDLSEHAIEAAAETEAVGLKIIATLSQTYHLANHEHRCTASIGATLFTGHQQSTEELLKQADIAMYQSKKAGRDTLRFFDPKMQETINERAILEGELHKAIKNREFQLHYQIQVDSSRHPLGAEALIRWMHPVRGLVAPAQFITLAEETGLILEIGQWVLEAACAQLKAWEQDAHAHHLILAINVSAQQFRQTNFAEQLQATVQRHGIDPGKLKLELTESLLLDNVEEVIATMNTLKKTGVLFSLDDFGTGYSSLQYLKQLPLDQLKIDQSFVNDIASNNSDKAIVRTIIAMARNLNLDVIAEGVETHEQQQILSYKGCTHFQGFLFGKPLPIEQFMSKFKE